MISQTITITQPPPQPPQVWVWRVRGGEVCKKEKLKSLLATMKEACKRLPSPYHDQISQDINLWEHKFAEYKADLLGLKQSALALCFLCFNTVEYVMLFVAESREDKAQWLLAWKELQNILKETLPPGQNCAQFVETYQKRQAALIGLSEKKERIRVLFQKAHDELYHQANQMHQSSIEAFEKLKLDFSKFQADKEGSEEDVRASVDSLMQQLIQLVVTFRVNLNEAQDLENKVEEQENVSEQNLDDIIKLINRI